jgi:pimeloyl-ACP methyl ester carboxylesterase
MKLTKSWIDIHGNPQRVWVFRHEEPVSYPIVCLHEGLGCLELWRDFPEKLAAITQRDVFLFERFGHGQSGVLSGEQDATYQMNEARIALPEMLQKMELGKISLVGHSDGGSIALLFASFYPAKVQSIITMAAHVHSDPTSVRGIEHAIDLYENKGLREKMLAFHGAGTDGMFRRWSGTWTNPQFRDWNIIEELRSIICPTLAIQGDRDEYGESSQISIIAETVQGPSEAWLVPDTGHSPHLEQSRLILERIAEFFQKHRK